MQVNQLVDAVYVLSVRSFHDRIAHIRTQMARHDISFEFIFDYDANAIPEALLARRFAPSDMQRAHQSLVLKHLRTWEFAVERGLRHVLVFEDDAELAADFVPRFAAALQELQRCPPGHLLYLGRGDNKHVGRAADRALIAGGPLPATDALVFDQEAARRRLAYLQQHRITRPADWLMREVDAAVGVAHYWLARPIVEQGSMNGRFDSVLDWKRISRGRMYTRLRYRWFAWWRGMRARLRDAWRPPA